MGGGQFTPGEAQTMASMLEGRRRAIETKESWRGAGRRCGGRANGHFQTGCNALWRLRGITSIVRGGSTGGPQNLRAARAALPTGMAR